MVQIKLYPKLLAQFFESEKNREEFFLFNTATNKGFAVDGYAALLCKKFTGAQTLEVIIAEFELENQITKDTYSSEIESLIADLERYKLIAFFESSQA